MSAGEKAHEGTLGKTPEEDALDWLAIRCSAEGSRACYEAIVLIQSLRLEVNRLRLQASRATSEDGERVWHKRWARLAGWAGINAVSTDSVRCASGEALLRVMGEVEREVPHTRAALSAPPLGGQTWQDIESAPKDGTVVWLCGDESIFSGYWSQERGWWEWYGRPAQAVYPDYWRPIDYTGLPMPDSDEDEDERTPESTSTPDGPAQPCDHGGRWVLGDWYPCDCVIDTPTSTESSDD